MPAIITVYPSRKTVTLRQIARFISRFGLATICLLAASVTPALAANEPTMAVVLNRPLNRGDVISESDLDVTELKKGSSGLIYVTDPGQLVGMSAKRPLRSGVPLRTSDVAVPKVVTKGEIVTMAFEAPGMSLSVRGKSLDDGLLGDTIRVLNTQTNRAVEATVAAPGYVLVSSQTATVNTSQIDAQISAESAR